MVAEVLERPAEETSEEDCFQDAEMLLKSKAKLVVRFSAVLVFLLWPFRVFDS